ncbi:MAG: hypothetical protein AB1Z98_09515 [Nannocystaceae bacterium]
MLIAQVAAPSPGDPNGCNDLLSLLAELLLKPWTHQPGQQIGLAPRYFQQIYGNHQPGTSSWTNHDTQFRGQQRRARELVEQYRDGCGDPPEWTRWVYVRAPGEGDWKGGGVPREVRERLDEQWGNAIVAQRTNTTSGWEQFGRWWLDSFLPGLFTTLAAIGGAVWGLIKWFLWDSWQPV